MNTNMHGPLPSILALLQDPKAPVRRRSSYPAYDGLPARTRCGYQFDTLRRLTSDNPGAVLFEVEIAIGHTSERRARQIITGVHQQPKPMLDLRRGLARDFAAVGLPCSFIATLRETYVESRKERAERAALGLSPYRLSIRMVCALPEALRKQRAFTARLKDSFGNHATDRCVRMRPATIAEFLSAEMDRQEAQDEGVMSIDKKDPRRFTGRSFFGPVISMSDPIAKGARVAYEEWKKAQS